MTRTSQAPVIWAAVTSPELVAIEDERWRSWPVQIPLRATRDRDEAVANAKRLVGEHGTGNVIRLEVQEHLISDRAQVDLRSLDVSSLSAALASAITADAEYLGPIADLQIREAEAALGCRFPSPWRSYVQTAAWFRRGWMRSGAYVWLYTPSETVEYVRVWGESTGNHPGIIIIGGDGGGEMLTLDARDPKSPVMLTPNVSPGWGDSIEQARTIEAFTTSIDDGTFEFAFE